MSTQDLETPKSVSDKPLYRLQQYLIEVKTSVSLLRDVLVEIKWEKIELSVYRTIVLVHLIKYLWYSMWH